MSREVQLTIDLQFSKETDINRFVFIWTGYNSRRVNSYVTRPNMHSRGFTA